MDKTKSTHRTNKETNRSFSHEKTWTAHGISYGQFCSRLRIGWDEWSAATVPIQSDADLIDQCKWMTELGRKYPLEIVELAAKNGISHKLFVARIGYGWGWEQASTLPPSPSNSAMMIKRIYGDNYYKNIRAWLFAKAKK